MIINFKNIKIKTSSTVYTPAEDTFFLEDILRDHLLPMDGSFNKKVIAEMGCGSGYITIFLMKQLPNCIFYAIDKNKEALKLTFENVTLNDLSTKQIKLIHSDLFSNIAKQSFDLMIFNPPYLPPEIEPKSNGTKDMYRIAWEGGDKVINLFLQSAEEYLQTDGRIIIILSQYQIKDGNPANYIDKTSPKLQVNRSFKKHLPLETLYLVELTRKHPYI